MPELPEVETSCRGVRPYLENRVIHQIDVRCQKLRWPIADTIRNCRNQKILSVTRRAKYILLELPKNWLVIHLGMTGSLRILLQATEPQKHEHIDLVLDDGTIMRYTDPRRFGAWLWCDKLSDLPQLQQLGPEPLSDEFDADYLLQQAQRRKVPVKSWIMQNVVVVGVGNIYASESLFMAQIHPLRACNSLTLAECQRLVESIKHVLAKSIEQGGTTLKDFLQSDGKPGYFAQQLQVYGRKQQACFRCGEPIQSQVIAQRNTYFCEHCQQ